MDLGDILKLQILADENRGFPVKFETDQETISQVRRDLVGLYGEIGEFSNLIKKVGIKLDRPEYAGPSLSQSLDHLREELIDLFIYLMRLAALLNTDLESELLKKIRFNKARYGHLESD